jgi:hypothetical protein
MKTLDEIAIECGTDKSSLSHNYCVKYERFLPFNRKDKLSILEIGIAGGDSLKMWKQFYPNSTIIGLDVNPNCRDIQFEKGIDVIIGSATDENCIEAISGEFDLILDDASHFSTDMIKTLDLAFKKVKSGGVYVIEDTCCSYWDNYSPSGHQTIIEYLKCLCDDISYNGYKLKNRVPEWRNEHYIWEEIQPTYFQKNIESIMFCNSTVIIFKK